MRTAIFVGLLAIASAIGKQTGWTAGESAAFFATLVIIFIIYDTVDFFRGIGGRITN